MNINRESEYYLHENGKLIFKPHGGVDFTSNFVKEVWNALTIGRTPESFVAFLIEAKERGADQKEIFRLAHHNKLVTFIPDWESKVFK